jgi:hypothetical protein
VSDDGSRTEAGGFAVIQSTTAAGSGGAGIAGSLIAVPSCVQKDHDKCGEQTDHHCDGCPIKLKTERVNHCLSRQRELMVVVGINRE